MTPDTVFLPVAESRRCLECVSVFVRVEKFFIQIQARLVEHFLKVPTWVVVCTLRAQAALNMEAELLRKGGHGYVSISIADGGFSPANLFFDSSFFFFFARPKNKKTKTFGDSIPGISTKKLTKIYRKIEKFEKSIAKIFFSFFLQKNKNTQLTKLKTE